MNISLYGRRIDRPNLPYIVSLIEELKKAGAAISVYGPYAHILFPHLSDTSGLSIFEKTENLRGNCDYLFSIGGDGTMLSSIQLVQDTGIPVVGLNIGRLGFLSSVSKDEISRAIDFLIKGNYWLDRRILLNVESDQNPLFGEGSYGLNELTVNKTDTSSMITVDVEVDGKFFSRYWADGLIIATPTGSTAYNLSCGGPVITPDCRTLAITPIAPHNLNVRPIVIPDTSRIHLRIHSRSGNYLASIDSKFIHLKSATELTVTKKIHTFNILRLSPDDYFSTLRTKLFWGNDARNANKFGN